MKNNWIRAAIRLAAISVVLLGSGSIRADDPNLCDRAGEAPDVIVGALEEVVRWGEVDNITAFSVGTSSCNIGTCQLDWISDTAEHPVIGQSMYRLKDGRFEQLGQSWLKHGFFALSLELCDTGCIATDGRHLGVNCSDPYSASLNGNQFGLGPKFEVNPTTGEFPYPPTDHTVAGNAIYKRLQVHNADLVPNRNVGALYFVEGHYVTLDDAVARNQNNNASYRPIQVLDNNGTYAIILTGETQREQPALMAWGANDPEVVTEILDLDGRFILASKVSSVGSGFWQYEYAVQNLNSDRAAGTFEVPIPAGADVQAIGFHDVDYHSGEPIDGTDWVGAVDEAELMVRWTTDSFATNPNANAIRWGTVYNFRFVANIPPGTEPGRVRIGLFKPGTPAGGFADLLVPASCDGDGICDPGEDCVGCAIDCVTPEPDAFCCGDDVCSPGEDSCGCAADCGPCIVPCSTDPDCDDGLACNGVEACVDNVCQPGTPPCVDGFCDEETDLCLDCLTDDHCDDGLFCSGTETCVDGSCLADVEPCPDRFCSETIADCVDCLTDDHCDNELFCDGPETCESFICVTSPDPCEPGTTCDENIDLCIGCSRPQGCDDGLFCNGSEECFGDLCLPGASPCSAEQSCDEISNTCRDTLLQPAVGEPLIGLTPDQRAAFDVGRAAFMHSFDDASGLGPIYNGTACASCHDQGIGGPGNTTVTRFGLDDAGSFDPLPDLGGSLLQSNSIRPECGETVPAEANIVGQRLTTSIAGAGLVDAIPDADIVANEITPPAGVSGRANRVEAFEDPGTLRIGRYGWKAQMPTLLSCSADETRNALGLTHRLLLNENAPNGDLALLGQCDDVPEPEITADKTGEDFLDHVTDFARYLAPPPQTPQGGMSGEVQFFLLGCVNCHRASFFTADDPAVPDLLRDRILRPYSDFLLHDMGANGEGTGQGDAAMGEVRTAPLWGLRSRARLWHDGRISAGTFDERVRAAIALHDVDGGEGQAAAQAFASTTATIQNLVVGFLGSLGRIEFDFDGNQVVDQDDFDDFLTCFTGPGFFFSADNACAVFDYDQDRDVDNDDYGMMLNAFEGGFGGQVPNGADVPGVPLTVNFQPDGQLLLEWGESCRVEDIDYEVYQGTLGNFYSHFRRKCSTDGATSATVLPASGSVYYLIVPSNRLSEGSYGVDSTGHPRPAALNSLACAPQVITACE